MKDIIKKKQNSAAKKQELFDVKVLKMKWNQTIYGEKSINQHDVSKQAKKYLKKNRTFSGLKDWYPLEYSKIKLYAGRLMCQKVNVDWDKELRRKYHIFLCVSFAATILVLLCYILLNEEYYSNVMIKLSPIIPIGVYYIKKINSNIKLMTSYEKAETQAQLYMDELFKDEGNERIFERKSRELQDSIFKTRKETILIWNWFYKLFRNNDEQNMIDTSKELVKEYCNYNHKDG
jgi:hypothetical protein